MKTSIDVKKKLWARLIMVLSHKYKFIFVKTSKTAGTSLEVFLSDVCGEADIFSPILPAVESHRPRNFQQGEFTAHMSCNEIRARVGSEIWDTYYKFCVERNPWDKVLSHYHMQRFRSGDELGLEEYFQSELFPRDWHKYANDDGQLLVNKVLRYETLNVELTNLFNILGVPFTGELQVRAKSEYRKDRRHYTEALTESQRQKIDQAFEKEINFFQYAF